MPSNFSSQEQVTEIIESETRALHDAEAYVRFYWSVFSQEPTNTSLATLYGAFLALTAIYRRVGSVAVIPKMLAKLEPALFHILVHSDRFDFESIYPHIDLLITCGEFSRAKKVALRCIKIIMSKNTDLTLVARRALREQLQYRFMTPIEQRLQWQQESIQLMDSMALPTEWFEIIPREDGLSVSNWSYEIVTSAWKDAFNTNDESEEDLIA